MPDYLIRDGATYRILADHLGSPRLVIDTTTGAVVQRMDFDEWGVVMQDTNPGWMPFGFAGGLYEPTSGLVRFGARDLQARMGRWASKDPSGFPGGSSNLLAYSSGDPMNLVDPTGLSSFYCELAGNAAWGLGGPGAAGSLGLGFDSEGNVFFFATGGLGVGAGAGAAVSSGLSEAPTGMDLEGPGGMLTLGTPWGGGSLGRSGPAGEQAPVYWAAELSAPGPNASVFSGATQTTVFAYSVRDAMQRFMGEFENYFRDVFDYSIPYPLGDPGDGDGASCNGCP